MCLYVCAYICHSGFCIGIYTYYLYPKNSLPRKPEAKEGKYLHQITNSKKCFQKKERKKVVRRTQNKASLWRIWYSYVERCRVQPFEPGDECERFVAQARHNASCCASRSVACYGAQLTNSRCRCREEEQDDGRCQLRVTVARTLLGNSQTRGRILNRKKKKQENPDEEHQQEEIEGSQSLQVSYRGANPM